MEYFLVLYDPILPVFSPLFVSLSCSIFEVLSSYFTVYICHDLIPSCDTSMRGGCDFDSQIGRTVLMYAVQQGRADCARLLIDAGVDKDAKDEVRRRSLLC
jgi:hypothetical protein